MLYLVNAVLCYCSVTVDVLHLRCIFRKPMITNSNIWRKDGIMKENKKSLGLILKLVLIAIASVTVTALILLLVSRAKLKSTYENLIKEELKVACEELDSKLSYEYDGDWVLTDEGLMKGPDLVQDEYEKEMDDIKAKTGLEYTLFYGDTRIVTTIKKTDGSGRLVGTKASDAVIKATLQGGQDYLGTNLNIEGQKFYGYYTPLKNSDGSIVGMCFTGRLASDVSKGISQAVALNIIIAVLIVVIVAILGTILNKIVSTQMKSVSDSIVSLAQGNLDTKVDESALLRGDELGAIARSTKTLVDELNNIVSKLKNAAEDINAHSEELSSSSSQASAASAQVSNAMDDIAKGAVSQADSIQISVGNTESIGMSVETIAESVTTLNDASDEMKTSCYDTMNTLTNLIKHSEKVSESVGTIASTIESTNKSANAISEFTDAINSIASQTNLLSLNASIEAARAGEAGKGFAVVAEEIGKLADDSAQSANEIREQMSALLVESQSAVSTAQEVREATESQKQILETTIDSINTLISEIESTVSGVRTITGSADACTDSKNVIVEAMDSLSAISEENAAACEETSASMQELNATVNTLASAANNLSTISDTLIEEMKFFKE